MENFGDAHVELAAEVVPFFFHCDFRKCLLRLIHHFQEERGYLLQIINGFLGRSAVADSATRKGWEQSLESASLFFDKGRNLDRIGLDHLLIIWTIFFGLYIGTD